MRTERISTWLDTGTIDATLETNCILLDRGADNTKAAEGRPGVTIRPPVFIHPSAEVSEAVIGPHASIGANCRIHKAVIEESIIEDGCTIEETALRRSLIGRNCIVRGQMDQEQAAQLNIGDNSTVIPG